MKLPFNGPDGSRGEHRGKEKAKVWRSRQEPGAEAEGPLPDWLKTILISLPDPSEKVRRSRQDRGALRSTPHGLNK